MPISLGVAQGEIDISTRGVDAAERRVKSAASKMTNDLGGIGKGVGALQERLAKLDSFLGVTFLVGAAVGIGKTVFELGKAAAQAEVTEAAFQKLARGVGLAGDEILQSMRETSRGTVTDSALILGANRAISSGIADSGAELNQMLGIARATGQAFGFSTEEAFEKIVRGVSKLEPELLDELGIMVRLDDLFRSYAASIGTTAASLNEAQRRQALFNEVARQSADEVAAAAAAGDTAADKYGQMAVATDNLATAWGNLLNEGPMEEAINFISRGMENWTKMAQDFRAELESVADTWRRIGLLGERAAAPGVSGTTPWGNRGAPRTNQGAPLPVPRFDEAQRGIIRDHFDAVTELEQNSNRERLRANRQYTEAVADTERDYHQSSTREAQDFATSRLRAEADFAESLADLRQDAVRREADQLEDFTRANNRAGADSAERIEEAREDSNKRLVELEEDFNKTRERAAKNHRDKLMDAAGRLDAQAVYEEQRNFARESKDAQEAHDEQRADLQEQLAERIADEQEALEESNADRREAYERQLEDGRENDRLREEEMTADFEKRKVLEDEDRALRLQRAAEDYAARQAEMARQHALDLEQIRQSEATERALLKEEADKKLHEAKLINDEWIAEDTRRTDAAVANWDRAGNAALRASQLVGFGERAPIVPYSPSATPLPSWMTGPSRDTPSRGVTVQSASVTVNVPPSEAWVGDIVVREIMEFFEGLANGRPQ